MKTIRILGGNENTNAIKVLTAHLTRLEHKIVRTLEEDHDAGFSWGHSYIGPKPFLNAEVNQFNKFECFRKFQVNDILCPFTFPVEQGGELWDTSIGVVLPWLARKVHHMKGKDIRVCSNWEQVKKVIEAKKHDFFSVFIPTETEYRVWVFQDEAFAVYEKQYKGEGEYKGYMRNLRFGFKFEKRDDLRVSAEITVPCIKAVKALSMDFGAVDLLKGKDGKFYVLEVNSMPAIEHTQRSSGIRLANQISKWVEAQ